MAAKKAKKSGKRNAATPKRRANKAGHISMADIAKFPPAVQAQIRAQLGTLERAEEKASTPKQKKAVELRKRGLLSRLRTRLNVLRKSKKFTVTARDTARCPKKKIKVRALTEDNAVSLAKRRLGSRYDQVRVQNGKRRNGVIEKTGQLATSVAKRTIKSTGKLLTGVGKVLSNPTLPKISMRKPTSFKTLKDALQQQRAMDQLYDRVDRIGAQLLAVYRQADAEITEAARQGTPSAALRAKYRGAEARSSRAQTLKGKISLYQHELGKQISTLRSQAKKNPCGGRRRNESGAEARREEFAGKVTGYKDLFFSEGTPQGLSTLGPLRLIRTAVGDIQPVNGGAWLCQDAKGKLFIGASSERPLWNGTAQSFGAVKRVEYECAKPHLGEPGKVIWFHDFEAPLPELHADGHGGLRFVGGGYTIQREGIVG